MADWYYAQGTMQRGPVPLGFVIDSLRTGALTASDLVWRDGMAQWMAAGQVPELAGSFSAPSAVPPPMSPPPMVASYPSAAPAYPGGYYQQTGQSPHAPLAIVSMILGFLGPVLGVAGLICGIIALRGMRRTGNFQHKGLAVTGVVLGSCWAALLALLAGVFILAMAGFLTSAHHMSQFNTPNTPNFTLPPPTPAPIQPNNP